MTPHGQQRLLGDRYRLLSEIGRGGMGTVWRAHDERLDREVAVKEVLLPPGLTAGETDVLYERTFREARASARLNHPSVVTVHDVVAEGDRPCIVMELVRAPSLQDVLDEHGTLPHRQVADIGRQVLGALTHAHQAGILHRDVKPSNVLLAQYQRVVLTDFGIAHKEGDASLTQTGLVMGSPAYIAPERVQGLRAVPASDVWALGATLYTCVEGHAPYERDNDAMATLTAALSEPVPPARNAGPLRHVLDGLLQREPGARMTAATAIPLLTRIALAEPPAPMAVRDVSSTAVDPAGATVTDPPVVPSTVPDREGAAWLATVARRAEPPARADEPVVSAHWNDEQRTVVQPMAEPRTVLQPVAEQRTVVQPRTESPTAVAAGAPAPAQRRSGRGSRGVVLLLVLAVVVALALVVGALLLRQHLDAGAAGVVRNVLVTVSGHG